MFRRIAQFFCNPIASRIHLAGWLRTRCTRALEDEVTRLRAENRALVNSVLGIAGIPPGLDAGGWRLEAREKANAGSRHGRQASSWPGRRATRQGRQAPRNDNAEGESDSLAAAAVGSPECSPSFVRTSKQRPCETASIAPLRRRSWQQIGRALGIGDARAARLERESDTETFPTPRNVVPRSHSTS